MDIDEAKRAHASRQVRRVRVHARIEDASLRHLIRLQAYGLPKERTKNRHYVIQPTSVRRRKTCLANYRLPHDVTTSGQQARRLTKC